MLNPPNRNRRVLIIDDNRAIHDDFRKILAPEAATASALAASEEALFGSPPMMVRSIPFDVNSAYQGAEGVALVEKALAEGRPYAMAFVDVRMPPGLDGVETTLKLWQLDPDLQVVLCTAYSDYTWGEMFEKLGDRDGLLILKKPFDAVEASQMAHALTEKWWLHKEARKKMERLEEQVAARTVDLRSLNDSLQNEVVEHQRAETRRRESEDLLTQAQRIAHLGHWKRDFTTGQLSWSDEVYRIFGVAPERFAVSYEAFLSCVHPADRPLLERAQEEVLAGRGLLNVEHRVIRPDGTIRWVREQAELRFGSDGQPNRYIGTVLDITDQRLAEQEMRESEERFSSAFEHAPIGVALVSPAGRWLKVNRALCDLVGYSESELLTRTFQDITHPEDLDADLENVRRLMAGEIRSYQMEKRYIHKRGNFVTILLNVSLVRDAQGQSHYFISQIQDITERKRAEDELRESNEKFRQLADNITDVFWIRSPDRREVHYVSPGFERIWGRTVASLYANPQQWSEFIVPEDRERVLRAFADLAGERPCTEIDYRIRRPDGEIRWVRLRGFQVRDAAEKLIRLIGIVTDITERRHAIEELRESERRFSDMLRNLELIAVMLDRDGRMTYCNVYLLRLTGWTREAVIGQNWCQQFLPPESKEEMEGNFSALLANDPRAWHYEHEILTNGGARRLICWNNSVLRSASAEVIGVASIGEDITERTRLEAQLFQSQKMETVGKLAGGVAHEFNSIMTAIIGQSELLLIDLSPGHPLCKNAIEIRQAAERAATLTRQLLAFGRKQILQPGILNLNAILAGMESSLRHILGRGADLLIVPGADLKLVKADPGQIEQVVLNIVMNAADAMPNGGKLTLETANVSLDAEYVKPFPELKAGEFVMLAITDTGAGMTADVKARVFEPFFSTKGVGQGTGLGLSTCDGIVRQSGGHLAVYSEIGQGATFKIYLPEIEAEATASAPRVDSVDLPRGTETILLVEDDPALLEMATTLLRRLGYTVLPASDGLEALRLKKRRDVGHIDLLFTDVVMPHMNGKELADRVRALYPHTKTLFTSAFTENAIVHQGILNKGVVLLQKPFTPSALAHKLREVLDAEFPPEALVI